MLPLAHTSDLWRKSDIEPLLKGTAAETLVMLETIKPVIHTEGRELWTVKPPAEDLATTAYLWGAEKDVKVDKSQVKELAIVTIYATAAYVGFVKPDLVETMAQIPKDLHDRVAYFELLTGDAEIIQMPIAQKEWFETGMPASLYGHRILMRLYEKV